RRCRGVLGGAFEHGGDLGDGDDVEVQRAPAGGVGRFGAVALHQAEQPVHLPHLRPRQVVVEEALGVDADVGAVPGGGADQPLQVAHRVGGLVGGQVGRVGGSAARRLARVRLDQLPAVEQ